MWRKCYGKLIFVIFNYMYKRKTFTFNNIRMGMTRGVSIPFALVRTPNAPEWTKRNARKTIQDIKERDTYWKMYGSMTNKQQQLLVFLHYSLQAAPFPFNRFTTSAYKTIQYDIKDSAYFFFFLQRCSGSIL